MSNADEIGRKMFVRWRLCDGLMKPMLSWRRMIDEWRYFAQLAGVRSKAITSGDRRYVHWVWLKVAKNGVPVMGEYAGCSVLKSMNRNSTYLEKGNTSQKRCVQSETSAPE